MRAKLGVAAVVVAALIVPGAALGGKRVFSGQQSLQIRAKLTPNTAARHSALAFHIDYEGPAPGQQAPYNARTISFLYPRGLVLNPKAAAACKRSAIDAAKGNASVCPAKSKVGRGTAVINAAPTIPAPILATVSIYNSVNDTGAGGEPKGTRNVLFYAQTSIGANSIIAFRISKLRDGQMKLVAKFTKPTSPGITPGSFTIEKVDVTIRGSGRKAYMTNPPRCSGGWTFAMTLTNYFGQPSVTAHDRARCRA
jgi:hypothetical protein